MKKFMALILAAMMVATMSLAVSAKDNSKVDAPYFNVKPTVDGVVTAEEWGEPTVKVTPEQASSYYRDETAGSVLDITYDLWLRWDETYLYVAVVTNDPDGHSLPEGEGSLWNGDAIQFRADPAGANGSGDKDNPWSDAAIPNMAFGLLSDGTLSDYEFQAGGPIEGAKYSVVNNGNKTTYEAAVPHALLTGKGEADFVYGVSLVRLNAPTGEGYNCWLTWGDGVCGPQENDDRCGSNAVKLVKTDAIVVPAAEPEVEAPVTAPVTDDATAAQTSDVEYVMFTVLALISLAGAFVVTKKARR